MFPKTGGGYQYSDGNINEVDVSVMGQPGARTGAGTLTPTEVGLGLILTSSTGDYSLTMPTAADLDAYFVNPKVGQAWSMVIVGTVATNTITLAGNTGVTVVGNPAIVGVASMAFTVRKSGATTYAAYRN
jgi:hypothetical protein